MAFMLLGCLFLSMSNGNLSPFPMMVLFFTVGLLLHQTTHCMYERRAFLLSFGVCVLVAGVAQFYTQTIFGQLQTESDAQTFYELSSQGWGRESLRDIYRVNDGPLAIMIWRWLYSVGSRLGMSNGPWLGVLFNGFLVGMASSLTVRTGRYFFGRDAKRLKLIGTLFASCGIFWLFGAIFLRDSLILLLNLLILYGFVRALAVPRPQNILILATILVVTSIALSYLRFENLLFIGLFIALGGVCWTRRTRGGGRLLLCMVVVIGVLVVLYPLAVGYYNTVSELAAAKMLLYRDDAEQAGSLGYAIVVGQPMPIRLITGSIYMHIFPIPLWVGFNFSSNAYHWLKSFQGVFLVAIVPLGFGGLLLALKTALRGGPQAPPVCFLALFVIFTLLTVVATSLETRHHGQFLPAFLLLAAIPNWRHSATRSRLVHWGIAWYVFVVVVHVLWLARKHV